MMLRADVVVVGRRVRLWRLQQVIAVAMGENAMLPVDEETTSSAQLPPAHLQQLNGRVRCEDEVLVGLNEHKDDGEGTADNHPVGQQRNGSRCEDCAQVDPSSDRWRQLTDALLRIRKNIFNYSTEHHEANHERFNVNERP